jgi:hypothetical protein
LLLRGFVIATYVTDTDDHPAASDPVNPPKAVYCDLVVYPSIPKQRWFFLPKVLVSQRRGGLHDDDLWKPKAATMNVITQVLDEGLGSNPAQLDGDHVLVGFLNDSYDEPIILRGLPHPTRDIGNELYGSGKRLVLKQVDGCPDMEKFQGTFRGVDADGNYIVDTTFGHNGELLPGGVEPPPDTTGTSGNQTNNLPKDSKREVVFYDMTAPLAPVEVGRFSMSQDAFEILLLLLPTLKVEGNSATAKLTLGSGDVSAAIAETLELLWADLVTWLSQITVPTGTGPSGVPLNNPPPSWNALINSTKVKFPNG